MLTRKQILLELKLLWLGMMAISIFICVMVLIQFIFSGGNIQYAWIPP